MTPMTDTSFIEQREKLRQKLSRQRQLITQYIHSSPGLSSDYPRSMTMRFLIQRPALAAMLGTEFLTLVFGVRFSKWMTAALAMIRIMRFSLNNKQKCLPSPSNLSSQGD